MWNAVFSDIRWDLHEWRSTILHQFIIRKASLALKLAGFFIVCFDLWSKFLLFIALDRAQNTNVVEMRMNIWPEINIWDHA